MVNDACYATYQLTILVSQEILCLAKLEGCILVLTEGVKLVAIQGWRIIGTTLIQLIMEVYKGSQTPLVRNFSYFY
jgi:hypothetical protein